MAVNAAVGEAAHAVAKDRGCELTRHASHLRHEASQTFRTHFAVFLLLYVQRKLRVGESSLSSARSSEEREWNGSLRGRSLGLFFFQAEDGIRDYKVTGVQTCALP